MKPIASTLALAASVALAGGLIVVLAMHLPVTPSMPGTEAAAAAAQDPTIALPSIAMSDLARRVKTGGIRSTEVVDQQAIEQGCQPAANNPAFGSPMLRE
jgi:hypothetical protein